MGDKPIESEDEITKMFSSNKILNSDEQLALHIMHKFNIDRETMESMPAFEEHIRPLFLNKKDE